MKAFNYENQELQPKHNCWYNVLKNCQYLECPSFLGRQVQEDDLCLGNTGKSRSVTVPNKIALKGELEECDLMLKELQDLCKILFLSHLL